MKRSPTCNVNPPKISGSTRASNLMVSPFCKKEAHDFSKVFNWALDNGSAEGTTAATSPRWAFISSTYLSLILLASDNLPFSAKVPKNAFVVGVNLPFAKMASMSAFLLTRGMVGLDKKARNASLESTWPTKFFRSASTFSKLPAAPAAWKSAVAYVP